MFHYHSASQPKVSSKPHLHFPVKSTQFFSKKLSWKYWWTKIKIKNKIKSCTRHHIKTTDEVSSKLQNNEQNYSPINEKTSKASFFHPFFTHNTQHCSEYKRDCTAQIVNLAWSYNAKSVKKEKKQKFKDGFSFGFNSGSFVLFILHDQHHITTKLKSIQNCHHLKK